MPGDLPSIEDLLKEAGAAPQPAAAAPVVSDTNVASHPEQGEKGTIVSAADNPAQLTSAASNPERGKAESKGPANAPTTDNPQPTTPKNRPRTKTESILDKRIGNLTLKGKEEETEASAKAAGIPYINLEGFAISADSLSLISEAKAKEMQVIPFLYTGPELRIGAVNPADEQVKELVYQLGERKKTNAVLYQISAQSHAKAIELYKTLPKIINNVKGVQLTEEELDKYRAEMKDIALIGGMLQKATVTDIIAVVIAASLELRSSDIHIEAEEKGIMVRLRVDGILQEIAEIDKTKWKKIINRIKLIAGLKLNVNDRPQDGRFTIFQKGGKIDVRTSTMPTSWGESVVMRILNPESIQLKFEDLGFRKAALSKLLREVEKPNGMIVTTGPTGSGKTTTLYAILSRLNKPGVKIITLEDPVEYKLEGINQSQIDASHEYTFAKGLRSILRQDPDIVMVGEIRDLETAETAIQAALTGHMLISTIHTNDAAGAIPRFLSMGVKPFLLAPAVNAVMGQRLARRLCSACKKEATLDADTQKTVTDLLTSIPENSGEEKVDTSKLTFYTAEGCDKCNGTGYKGRVGLYEILIKDPSIEQMILGEGISEYKVREIAAQQGMVSMAQDGLLKALEGLTSVEEIRRVAGL